MMALQRALGPLAITALTLNGVVGAGVLALPAKLAASAGPYSLAILAAAFALISLIALCTVEVASRFDRTGGPMHYAEVAFGPLAGFSVGWLMWVSRLASFSAITVVLLDYATGLWPVLDRESARAVAATALVAAFAGTNLRGVRAGAGLGNVLALAKLLPLLLLACAGLWLAVSGGWVATTGPASNLSEALLIALFACMGFEAGPVMAGEVRDPARSLARGVIVGVAIAGALYATLTIACLATVPDLARSTRPLAEAAAAIFGPPGSTATSVVAVISCAGALSVIALAAPRLLYALALQGSLPGFLAGVRPSTAAPHVAIVATSLLFWVLTLTGTFVYLATFSIIARLVGYAATCASLLVLRRRVGPAPLPVAGAPAMALVSLVSCGAVFATSTGTALRDVAIAMALGLALRFGWRRLRG
jgi:APA family basic amino acid/polyamine antiporter